VAGCAFHPRLAQAEDALPIRRAVFATLDWPPYIGRDLPEQGWVAAVVRAAFARRGLDLELRFMPWARGLLEVDEGRVDGLLPVYITPQRRRRYFLSGPLPAAHMGLFARVEDIPALTGRPLDELSDHVIGVVRGYVNHPAIDDPAGPWVKDEAGSDLLNLRKLAFGRVDLAVADHLVATWLAEHDPLINGHIGPLTPPLATRPTALLLARTTGRGATLVSAFDAGLASLQADGSLASILASHGMADVLLHRGRPVGAVETSAGGAP